jgi:type II secretory pathway component PulF
LAPCFATLNERLRRTLTLMSPTWIWMQAAIVVFVLIGMIVAIVKLA